MYIDTKAKNIFHLCISIFFIIIAISIAGVLGLKYKVEGEKSMPFEISKIMVVSTVEGVEKTTSDAKWDFALMQNNDIYINVEKNEKTNKSEIIDKIIIENIMPVQPPQKGIVKIFKPTTKGEKTIYTYNDEDVVANKLEYKGKEKSDVTKQEIANQGGMLMFRVTNDSIGRYTSEEDVEINHNGSLIKKAGINKEEIQFKLSMDIIIQLESKKQYKTNFQIDLPIDKLIEEGTSSYEKNDCSDLIFKRI